MPAKRIIEILHEIGLIAQNPRVVELANELGNEIAEAFGVQSQAVNDAVKKAELRIRDASTYAVVDTELSLRDEISLLKDAYADLHQAVSSEVKDAQNAVNAIKSDVTNLAAHMRSIDSKVDRLLATLAKDDDGSVQQRKLQ